MLIEINRKVLEQFVQDRAFMYKLVSNWTIETNKHYTWSGLSLHDRGQSLTLRPRGFTQCSIKYRNWKADYTAEKEIEKRILKYKGKR